MLVRRDLLKIAMAGLATQAPFAPAAAQAQSSPGAPAAGDPPRFDPTQVLEAARALSRQPWRKPPHELSEAFAGVNFEQYSTMRRKPGALVWDAQQTGFSLEPTHRGFIFTNNLQINLVEDGIVRRLAYDSNEFDFGKAPAPADKRDVGFAGFRLMQRTPSGELRDAMLFQGAGYFQTGARNQPFGAAARACDPPRRSEQERRVSLYRRSVD